MNPLSLISNLFSAVAGYFGWAKQKDAEENSPAMQANAAAQTRQDIAAQATKDVSGGDATLDQLRKDAGEG